MSLRLLDSLTTTLWCPGSVFVSGVFYRVTPLLLSRSFYRPSARCDILCWPSSALHIASHHVSLEEMQKQTQTIVAVDSFLLSSVGVSFLFIVIICLFLAALGLRCCCGERGPLSRCSVQASRCCDFSCCGAYAPGQAGFSSCGMRAPQLQITGSVAPWLAGP